MKYECELGRYLILVSDLIRSIPVVVTDSALNCQPDGGRLKFKSQPGQRHLHACVENSAPPVPPI